MHELHAAVFAPLLEGLTCDLCGPDPVGCQTPMGIDGDGEVRRGDEGLVVAWPRCPGSYSSFRRAGQDLLSLAAVTSWAYERGIHHDQLLGAGGHRLIRRWHHCVTLCQRLLKTRAIKRAKRS